MSLSKAFKTSPYVPDFFVRLCAAGEKSDQLPFFLEHACRFAGGYFKHKTGRFLAILEPIALLTVGSLLLWVVMAIFVPLYEHVSNVDF